MSTCTNVGTVDRTIRIVVGIVALVLAFTMLGLLQGSIAGIVAAAVGVVMLATAMLRVCPAYLPFGMSTCKVAAK